MKNLYFLSSLCCLLMILSCSNDDDNNNESDQATDPNALQIAEQDISHTTVNLKWEATPTTENNTTVVYDIFLEGNQIIESNTDTDYTLSQLKSNTTYNGEIVSRSILKTSKTKNGKIGVIKKTPFTLTTKQYKNPNAPEPNEFSITIENLSTTTANLKWSEATIADNSEIIYDVYIDGDKVNESLSERTFLISNLEKSTSYSGMIIAISSNEKSKFVPFSFTTPEVDITTIAVSEIQITPATLSIVKGESKQLTATVLPEDASNKNVTWTSSDTTIATVDEAGKVSTIAEGTVTITATSVENDQISNTSTIAVETSIVEVTEITITPSTFSLAIGGTQQLLATVLPEDATNKEVIWTSNDTTIVTVDDNGNVTAISEGTVTITATSVENDQMNSTSTITVEASIIEVTEIQIISATSSIAIGDIGKITISIVPENATNKEVTWSSSDTTIATVDDNGNITAINEGTVAITVASVEDPQITVSTDITIVASIIEVTEIQIVDVTSPIEIGDIGKINISILPENATNKEVTWSSSDTNIATVDNNGNITPINEGTVTLTVTSVENDQITVATDITVFQSVPVTGIEITPATLNDIFAGQRASLRAKILPENATNKEIVWTSSDPNIATVAHNGSISSIAPGTITITATSAENNQITASRTLTVLPNPISFDPATGLYKAPPGSMVTFSGNVGIGGPLDSGVYLELNAFPESNQSGDPLLFEITTYSVITPDLGTNEEDFFTIFLNPSITMPANGQIYLTGYWGELDPQNPFTSASILLFVDNDQGPSILYDLYDNFIEN